jgi:hypothetical protein
MIIIHVEEKANIPAKIEEIVTIDGVMDWILDLRHDSEVQVITAPSLISTLYKSPQHTKSFPACSVFTRRFLITASNDG